MTLPSTLERAARRRRLDDRRLLVHFALFTLLGGAAAPILGSLLGLWLVLPLAGLPGVALGAVLAGTALGLGAAQAWALVPRLTTWRGYVVATLLVGAPALWIFLASALIADPVVPALGGAAGSGALLGLGQGAAFRSPRRALGPWMLGSALGAVAGCVAARAALLDVSDGFAPVAFFLAPAAGLACGQTLALAVLLAVGAGSPAPPESVGPPGDGEG